MHRRAAGWFTVRHVVNAIRHAQAATASPGRRRRLRVAAAALTVSLAGRHAGFARVVEQARLLAFPLAHGTGS